MYIQLGYIRIATHILTTNELLRVHHFYTYPSIKPKLRLIKSWKEPSFLGLLLLCCYSSSIILRSLLLSRARAFFKNSFPVLFPTSLLINSARGVLFFRFECCSFLGQLIHILIFEYEHVQWNPLEDYCFY